VDRVLAKNFRDGIVVEKENTSDDNCK